MKIKNEPKIGDIIKDFRGDEPGFTVPTHPNSSGHTDRGSYYPSVFNLEWEE